MTIQIVDNKALLLQTDVPHTIIQSIPDSAVLEQNGHGSTVLVNWTLDNTRVLRNLGHNAPSPILGQYQWTGRHTPFAHQKVTADFMVAHPRAFILNEVGTGKSSSCIWAADYLMQQGAVQRVLVISPLSVLRAGWQDELFRTAMHRRVGVAYGAKPERVKVIQSSAEFVLINVDGIKLVADELAKADFDIIIVDEFTQFKNAQSQRWKCLNKLIRPHTRVWMLSGTPAPQGPCDAYGPVKLIAPHRVPKYFTAWQEMVMRKITAFKYVARENSATLVHEAMQPAIRFAKKDCLDLPPLIYQTVDVEMTPQQQKYYNQMKRDMMVASAGTAVTAVNAASRLVKLLQIAMGAVNTDADETVMHFDIAHRLNVVQDLIEAASGKVLIAVPYLNALHRLH